MSQEAINCNCVDYKNRSTLFYACANGMSSLALILVPLVTDEILNEISDDFSLFQCACSTGQ